LRLIDVHAHIQQHDDDELDGMLVRAAKAGVGAIIAAGVTVEDSRLCVELTERHPPIFAGVGVHPTDLSGPLSKADLDALDEMAEHPQVVVMSEVGIDHQSHVLERSVLGGLKWVDIQEEAFRQQIEIARLHGLPVVFHVREPEDDPGAQSAWPVALRVLLETSAGELGGAAHYFQGDAKTARQVLDAGFMVSLARPLLRLKWLQEVAAWAPIDRIVLETDSYPQPFKKDRAKWTEPRHVLAVADALAEIRGTSAEEVARRTTENALSMLGSGGDQVRTLVES
jgi:TatD DNase family protein